MAVTLSQSARRCELLTQSQDSSAIDAFVRGLNTEERSGLLEELSARACRPDGSAASLLRALLRAAPLRLRAARDMIRLMRSQKVSGKAAMLCMSELRIAVVQLWACGGGMHRSAASDAAAPVNDAPASQRRDEVLLMCSDLLAALVPAAALAPLVPRSADAQPTAAGPSAWSDGCTTAVQLLPTLLRAADAIEADVRAQAYARSAAAEEALVTPSAMPSARIVSALLAAQWEPRCVLPLLAALEDVPLQPEQRCVLRAQLRALLAPDSADLASLRPSLLGIGKHVVAHTDRWSSAVELLSRGKRSTASSTAASSGAGSAPAPSGMGGGGGAGGAELSREVVEWWALLMRLAVAMPPSELAGLLWLLEATMRHSPSLYAALLAHLKATTAQLQRAVRHLSRVGTAGEAATLAGIDAMGGADGGSGAGGAGPGYGDGGLGLHGPPDTMCSQCHVQLSIFLLLLQRSARPPSLLEQLNVLMGTTAAVLAVAAAWPLWSAVRRLLGGLVNLPALASRTELVLDLAHHLSTAEGASATWQLPSQPRLAPPAELRRGARAAAAVSAGSLVVLSTAAAPADGSVQGAMESGGDESGGDGSEGEEECAVTGALWAADGIAADDDEEELGGSDGSDGRTARGTAPPGGRASVAQAGGLLLLALFGSVPDARPQILSLVFDSMAQEDATPAQRRLWCGLLGAIASTHLHALHTHSAQLVDWTCCLPSLPAEAGRRVLAALMPLVPLGADFGRHLLLLLRKALVAPETRTRALAVYGFCGLLARGLLPSEPGAQSDAVLALRSACSMAPSLRALTFDELRYVLLAHAPTEPSARGLLYSLLLETLWWMALPGLQATTEGTTTTAAIAANAATATNMAPQPRQHIGAHGAGAMVFDASWAASLVRHAADDEGGGAAMVLPALVRCLAVASAVLPPASCDAQHRQLRVALQQLESALQPARLVAIFSHPSLSAVLPPPLKPSAKNAPSMSMSSSGACQGGGATTSSSGAMDATRRAQQRLHAISSLGMAIMGADMGADMSAVARCSGGADGRGATASGKASTAPSASAAHLEAHRDDDQNAKTASRRVPPSVTAATLRGAILVSAGIGSATGAGRVSLLVPCSRCL